MATDAEPRVRRPLGRVSTAEALVADLRNRILDGDFPVGHPLREVELAAEYGVGRHTLRAAFGVLVHDGLLRHEPFRGVSVPRLTSADILDLFRVRRLIEAEGLRAMVAAGVLPPALEAAVEALEALPDDTPWSRLGALDLAVHRAIVAAAQSPRMDRIMGAVEAEMRLAIVQLWRHREGATAVAHAHRALLRAIAAAIESGDVEPALSRLIAHLSPPPWVG
jgi:DNA-binding GntR family transcriptional regulator